MNTWISWLLQGLITVPLLILWFWVKRWINGWDERVKEWEREGGLITREVLANHCRNQQEKCPAFSGYKTLSDWRDHTLDKGGILSKSEHSAICKEITKETMAHFDKRIEELFDYHREWIAQELKLIRTEISSINFKHS